MLDKHMEDYKNGNHQAFDFIYKMTEKFVYSVCLSYMRDRQLAEDMMQDTYLKVMKYINKYRIGTNANAWIRKIAKNTCLNELKRRKKFELLEDYVEIQSNEKCNETPFLNIALKILKEKELQILLPHIIDNKKLVDIARELHIPEGTVRWKYNNSLNKIRKYYERSIKNETE